MSLWAIDNEPLELRDGFTESDLQEVIRGVYRQVLGNQHLMESDRFTSEESLLRNGDINVRQFVGAIANSDLYRRLFFESTSQYRFIELNFKHLLGRAPQDQAEISEHVSTYNELGYEAEISSYIYSDEYSSSFGDNTVPYVRTTQTRSGIKNVGFNRTFAIARGNSFGDSSLKQSKLVIDLGANLATQIVAPVGTASSYASTGKRFRVRVAKAGAGSLFRKSNVEYEVSYTQLTRQVQNIHRRGGRILSIEEAR
ncbi:phycobilisome linker polypeptide/CpcD/allophycocyanin linker domain protein [Rubidibacter lacunae KORDI 51-2]|uniref:Phycobilisome linker polypeptide/CpcD/allophycocyanin linker domain protein n=1 Tax=Rubidibacter lacunae KORDI 51-2 TaxID=582515 RepID=U5DJS9_9CHRO|nr:phycobilisome rod-core linker polypeptide [Rubidibacter lacunae]ERN41946.1 phycobilisome linker polypeptide/CpcD/allophycocyanin linker domain protein [Rubidibacter lacunae KORDI 51-2]